MGARISQDEFLKRAEQRFGDQYNYEGMNWRSYKSPVKIRCTHHPVQDINITPEKHLQTLGGCRHCLRERRVASLERELNRKSAERPTDNQMVKPVAKISSKTVSKTIGKNALVDLSSSRLSTPKH
ncbi:hypothetical protein Syncc9902_0854 [Synechococcus sp. CC9902]|uniref:hypothetical protein n=1 Tax=Synechococcus sp. (strain CC9902) TaxID=316279 RepID=UPI00005D3FE2|nr:hypothetical protein [Synechococcus sp. CC9902]ABB25820.1 hypothetical protein Syncc9902_0854 [Synechococcus sp. CC9902]